MDRAKFFAAAKPMFGGGYSQGQVEGIDAILDAWDASKLVDERWLAYMFATGFHETGGKFVASVESLNYSVDGLMKTFGRHRISAAQCKALGRSGSRPADQVAIANAIYGGSWGKENLGNTEDGDGWKYRGRGLVQITGRANYGKYGLTTNPDLAKEIKTAARVMVDGMVNGRFTGKKLAQFFTISKADPVGARATINGDDMAEKIAGHYHKFDAALKAANA